VQSAGTQHLATRVHACLLRAGEGEAPLEWNSGANGYVYFVANTLGGPLTQLPPVTPAQVGWGVGGWDQPCAHTCMHACMPHDRVTGP
jgi:hypothetical protein